MEKIINKYLPQVLLIVFSVVLGMYLNQKMLERADYNKANQLLSIIESEIKLNQKIVQDWQPYHNDIWSKLDSLKDDDTFIKEFQKDKNALYKLLTRGTLMNEMPSNSAWEITKLNPVVSEISYDKMNILAKTYAQQEGTFNPINDIITILNTPFMNSPKDGKENLNLLSNLTREMVSREIQLLHYYKEAIKILAVEN